MGRTRSTRITITACAAALAALAVLHPAPAGAATIVCDSEGGPCGATYTSGAGLQSNLWKFVLNGDPAQTLYTIEIAGEPLNDFALAVADVVIPQSVVSSSGQLANFPGLVCIPIYDQNTCAFFDVTRVSNSPVNWLNGYLMTITWFSNPNPLSSPPDDGTNTILRSPNRFTFTDPLQSILFYPEPVPNDAAISGREDGFSRFGVFRSGSVPEPVSLWLFGAGLAGVAYRRRQRRAR